MVLYVWLNHIHPFLTGSIGWSSLIGQVTAMFAKSTDSMVSSETLNGKSTKKSVDTLQRSENPREVDIYGDKVS